MPYRLLAAWFLLMFLHPAVALAQNSAPAATETSAPPAVFPPVTQTLPNLQSTSGRFSSYDPPHKVVCHNGNVTGRVVSQHLIYVDQFGCEEYGFNNSGYHGCCSLMNVELSEPSDTEKMVVGKLVTIHGLYESAREGHGNYTVFFLIAEKAQVVRGDPFGDYSAPVQVNTSFILCQPPELAGLSANLGRSLCVQSDIVSRLDVTASMLETAAHSFVKYPAEDQSSGDPNAIICRQAPEQTDAGLPSAVTCAYNYYWSWWASKQRSPNTTVPLPPAPTYDGAHPSGTASAAITR
jgi:hypothetical protein